MLNVCQNTSPQVCRTGASDNGPDGGAFANHFGPWMVTSVKKNVLILLFYLREGLTALFISVSLGYTNRALNCTHCA